MTVKVEGWKTELKWAILCISISSRLKKNVHRIGTEKRWKYRVFHCSAIEYLIVFLCCRFSFAGHKINYVLTNGTTKIQSLFLYSFNQAPESGRSIPGELERIMFYYNVEQMDHFPTFQLWSNIFYPLSLLFPESLELKNVV